MKKIIITYFLSLAVIVAFGSDPKKAPEWVDLLDQELSQWDVFIGVPHHTVDLPGYEKGDGRNGTPVGLNKDPLNVFSVVMEEGVPVLKITGEVYGGLSTKSEYENYHLSLKFKWGEMKYEPRLNDKRDSGILYHAQEPHGQFWNVWMKSPEMQVQEGDCGDFHPLVNVSMDIHASAEEDLWRYDPSGETYTFKSGADKRRCLKRGDYEKPNGEWNHLELICLGDKAYHIVNGQVVMILSNARSYDEDGVATVLNKGKIQIQSEGAELYYKEIKIKETKKLPKEFARQL